MELVHGADARHTKPYASNVSDIEPLVGTYILIRHNTFALSTMHCRHEKRV